MKSTSSFLDTLRARRQFVTIDGQQIAYVTAGERGSPPLLLVHGWLSYAGAWDSTLEALKDSFYCIAPDLLGFGFSDKPAHGDYSIPTQAGRVLALADTLGIDTFALAGHSMGGQIALYIAATQPRRVRRVASVCGVVTGELSVYLRAMYTPPLWLGHYVNRHVWDLSRYGMMHWRWYKHLYYDNANTYRKDVIPLGHIDLQMGVFRGIERPSYFAYYALQSCDLTSMLGSISAPVLLLHGENDNVVPVRNARHAHDHIPDNRLDIIRQCGHWPMYEHTERYIKTMRAFLGQL
jgi:pimeloyl-ACP methyl ester carboxylesterase